MEDCIESHTLKHNSIDLVYTLILGMPDSASSYSVVMQKPPQIHNVFKVLVNSHATELLLEYFSCTLFMHQKAFGIP